MRLALTSAHYSHDAVALRNKTVIDVSIIGYFHLFLKIVRTFSISYNSISSNDETTENESEPGVRLNTSYGTYKYEMQ